MGFRLKATARPAAIRARPSRPCSTAKAAAWAPARSATTPGRSRRLLPGWPNGTASKTIRWPARAAEMLRVDLDTCGIPYAVEGPDGPLFADFHALRHSFVALLDRTGASLKQAMHLARHSDPKLTMRRYGRPQLHDLQAAVD